MDENFERGRFTHNSVHNGTIWHWNRVVVGSGDEGQDYGVRIEFRPVSASADSAEMRHVKSVQIEQASEITLNLLYDPGFSLSDRAIQEQFLS